MEIVATNVFASGPPNSDRLQRRPLLPIQIEVKIEVRVELGRSPLYSLPIFIYYLKGSKSCDMKYSEHETKHSFFFLSQDLYLL